MTVRLEDTDVQLLHSLAYVAYVIENDNRQWWLDLETQQPKQRNFGEMIALAHSELSEALEAHRKSLMDSHLPSRPGVEVELADALIRIIDTAQGSGYDIVGAVHDKLLYNRQRADHKRDARLADNGKKY